METSPRLYSHDELSPAQLRIFRCAAALTALLLVPVPWKVDMSHTYGFANRLDGSLEVNGEIIDPPDDGEWSSLAVIGRPQTVGEVVMSRLSGDSSGSIDIRNGTDETSKPSIGVPAAVRIGLDQVGQRPEQIEARIEYNLRLDQTLDTFIDQSTMDWVTGALNYADKNQRLSNYYTGRSHGMMVALATYADGADVDLAQGRHIAGTGGIKEDGTITRIGSLDSKARAASSTGADVLLVPASQIQEIDTIPLPGTEVIPVETLQEAIESLRKPVQ